MSSGLFLATVGEYDLNGVDRFTFGSDFLQSGFGFLPVLIGLFAFSQLMSDIRDRDRRAQSLDGDGRRQGQYSHRAPQGGDH